MHAYMHIHTTDPESNTAVLGHKVGGCEGAVAVVKVLLNP